MKKAILTIMEGRGCSVREFTVEKDIRIDTNGGDSLVFVVIDSKLATCVNKDCFVNLEMCEEADKKDYEKLFNTLVEELNKTISIYMEGVNE